MTSSRTGVTEVGRNADRHRRVVAAAVVLFGSVATMSCAGDADRADVVDATDGCYGGPQVDCPCTRAEYESHFSCCLGTALGLLCAAHHVTTSPIYEWTYFNDCGCVAGPPCEGQVLYDLCPLPPSTEGDAGDP